MGKLNAVQLTKAASGGAINSQCDCTCPCLFSPHHHLSPVCCLPLIFAFLSLPRQLAEQSESGAAGKCFLLKGIFSSSPICCQCAVSVGDPVWFSKIFVKCILLYCVISPFSLSFPKEESVTLVQCKNVFCNFWFERNGPDLANIVVI